MRVVQDGIAGIDAGAVHANAVHFFGIDDPLRRVFGYARKSLKKNEKRNSLQIETNISNGTFDFFVLFFRLTFYWTCNSQYKTIVPVRREGTRVTQKKT